MVATRALVTTRETICTCDDAHAFVSHRLRSATALPSSLPNLPEHIENDPPSAPANEMQVIDPARRHRSARSRRFGKCRECGPRSSGRRPGGNAPAPTVLRMAAMPRDSLLECGARRHRVRRVPALVDFRSRGQAACRGPRVTHELPIRVNTARQRPSEATHSKCAASTSRSSDATRSPGISRLPAAGSNRMVCPDASARPI